MTETLSASGKTCSRRCSGASGPVRRGMHKASNHCKSLWVTVVSGTWLEWRAAVTPAPGLSHPDKVSYRNPWHRTCDSHFMKDQAESERDSVRSVSPAAHRVEPRELHSLQDLPASVGQVSSGPLGSVARKDHISWKSKQVTDPAYWSGWFDSALGERIHLRPIPSVAICFGTGLVLGVIMSCTGDLKPHR